jgi:hypothetical protein
MASHVTASSPAASKPRSLADLTDEEFAQRYGPPPDWLERLWADAEARGLDKMTMEEIDAEIEAYRAEKRATQRNETR